MSKCGTSYVSKGAILWFLIIFISNLNAADLKVTWDPNSETDLAGYKLYYGTASKNYPNVIDVNNQTVHIVSGLNDGVEYYFAVTAYDTASNESAFSEEVSAVAGGTDNTPPSPPTITNQEIQNLKVKLYWSANTDKDLKGYKVYYGTSSRAYTAMIDVGNHTSCITPELESGVEYFFAVTAYDSNNNESQYSNEILVLVHPPDTTAPSAPVISNYHLLQIKMNLSWQANSEPDLAGYRVYYGKTSRNYDGNWDVGLATNYMTPELIQGETYYFAVTAYDAAANESDFSTEISVTIPIEDTTPPPSPLIVRLEVDGRTIHLNWNNVNVADLDGYKVYYGTASRNYDTVVDVGNVDSVVTPVLSQGVKYYFAVTAYDTAGNESDFSKEMAADIPMLDITPPTIYAAEIRDSTLISLVYSESVEKTSAEDTSNYHIDNGIKIYQISLNDNQKIVQIKTSPHQVGVSYVLTVNNIKDLAKNPNVMQPNTSYTYQYNPQDQTPPMLTSVEILDGSHVDVTFSESINRQSAELKQNYTINNGITILEAKLDDNLRVVHLTTTAHQNNTRYTLTVNHIQDKASIPNTIAANSSKQYTYHEADNIPPAIYTVEISAENKVDIIFTEPVNQSSAENIAHYAIDNGIDVLQAQLDHHTQIVHLTTTIHQKGITYVITVNNVQDQAYQPNMIVPDSKYSYTYNPEDKTPPTMILVDIKNGTHVDVTFSEDVHRQSAEDEGNYQINNGIVVIESKLDMNQRVVHLTTTPHQSGQTYILTVNHIKDRAPIPNSIEQNSTMAYTYVIRDSSPPAIERVIAANSTSVEVIFNEIVERISAETAANYSINNGVQVLNATLYQDLKTVVLITTDHQLDYPYVLSVKNIRDRAYPPNVIENSASFEYHYTSDSNSSGSKDDMPPQPGDMKDPESLGPANVFLLHQNYPNPFNAGTEIHFQLPENCYVSLTIYNILGQTVRKLFHGEKQASHYIIHWDGRNGDGHLVPSGVYFSRLKVIHRSVKDGQKIRKVIYNDVRKMIFLK